MVFSGENVSAGDRGKLTRLAAVRGKLAVSGGEVISGVWEWQDHLVIKNQKGTNMLVADLCFCLFAT